MTRRPIVISLLAVLCIAPMLSAAKSTTNITSKYFDSIRDNPSLLRSFLFRFPKGGDLHNHLDGAIYAENYIAWAAEDGKCVDLETNTITMPPCDADENRPAVTDIQFDADKVNRLIDAFSVRNYERRAVSGHDQFFATFTRYLVASFGREGSMIAEVSQRAATQNVLYLELMQSFGMHAARELARASKSFSPAQSMSDQIQNKDLNRIVKETIAATNLAERQSRKELGCDRDASAAGCGVTVRYLAQVIRTFPRDQVLAQTLLAYKLIEQDPRYVGLNFVAPEDHPITLRDHKWQMEIIQKIGANFPAAKDRIALHAGELAMGLVAPEELRSHISEAVKIAGARRIGHGVDIVHEWDSEELLLLMAEQGIAVEVNLTSNAVILGIDGDEHPFTSYRAHGVPVLLSTDDEGVSRIDLTHEYQRAVQTYDLSYADIKEFSRNALAFSFLQGEDLFSNVAKGKIVRACARDHAAQKPPSGDCQLFLENNEKALLQWQLETRFIEFESAYR
ncbi:MAG: adenosine deaminase family protein [Pseudomonadales bacterium]